MKHLVEQAAEYQAIGECGAEHSGNALPDDDAESLSKMIVPFSKVEGRRP